jgi:hypothetical protein
MLAPKCYTSGVKIGDVYSIIAKKYDEHLILRGNNYLPTKLVAVDSAAKN